MTRRKTRLSFTGKYIYKLRKSNPRRESTRGFGYRSWELLQDGMTYEEYKIKGGRHNDLKWDLDRGWVEVSEDTRNEDIHYVSHEGIARLRLTRARKGNALSLAMLRDLEKALKRAEEEEDLRLLVLEAEGERAFCSGADVVDWRSLTPYEQGERWTRDGHRLFDRLAQLPCPTLAAVSGVALGGGLELLAACDVRIAVRSAWFSLPETGLGVVPSWSGTQRLARLLPESVLRDILLFGSRLSAERAYACGFVTEVVEDRAALERAVAEKIEAVRGRSPLANRLAKAALAAGLGEGLGATLETFATEVANASADAKEGIKAFVEKRAPVYPAKE